MKNLIKRWWQTAPGSLVAVVVIAVNTAGVIVYLQGAEPGKTMLVVVVSWLLSTAAVVRLAVGWDLSR